MELSGEYIASIVIFVVILVLLLVVAVGSWRDGERLVSAGSMLGIGVAVLVWFGINHPAFDMEYHSYQTVTGKVTEIERDNDVRMFELKGDERDLSCIDSWCTKVEIGDIITLECIRDDAPTGANTWECEFVKLKEADRV